MSKRIEPVSSGTVESTLRVLAARLRALDLARCGLADQSDIDAFGLLIGEAMQTAETLQRLVLCGSGESAIAVQQCSASVRRP